MAEAEDLDDCATWPHHEVVVSNIFYFDFQVISIFLIAGETFEPFFFGHCSFKMFTMEIGGRSEPLGGCENVPQK